MITARVVKKPANPAASKFSLKEIVPGLQKPLVSSGAQNRDSTHSIPANLLLVFIVKEQPPQYTERREERNPPPTQQTTTAGTF